MDIPIGVTGASSRALRYYPRTSNAMYGQLNSSGTSTFTDPGSTLGFSLVTRRGSADVSAYFNPSGAAFSTATTASSGFPVYSSLCFSH